MGRPKILIIEDEPSLLGLFEAYLGEHYDVLIARNGTDGCSILDGNHLSLILLDLKMPGMTGIEVLRQIRSKSPNLPVIVMTGYSSHEAAIKCADLGVQGYLLKPVKLTDLKRKVDNCLGIRQNELFKDVDGDLDEILKKAGPIVKAALKVINERFRDPSISRSIIAEAVGICGDYLSKQFHKECGISIPEYINRLRLAEASRLLPETNDRISKVAASLGFSNMSYFSSIFKKHFIMTPEQYRREKRI